MTGQAAMLEHVLKADVFHFGDVGAGRKRLVVTCQNDDRNAFIGLEFAEGTFQFFHQSEA